MTTNIELYNPLLDIEFVNFITDICDSVYAEIKDEYTPDFFSIEKLKDDTYDHWHTFFSKKMNVMLTICRNVADIKKLSMRYPRNKNTNSGFTKLSQSLMSKLYNHILQTIFEIWQIFQTKLQSHIDYRKYKDKTFTVYSGIGVLPPIVNNQIMNSNMLNTSLNLGLSLGYTKYYDIKTQNYIVGSLLAIQLTLNDFILPTMHLCKKKMQEVHGEGVSVPMEYEIIYFGNNPFNITEKVDNALVLYKSQISINTTKINQGNIDDFHFALICFTKYTENPYLIDRDYYAQAQQEYDKYDINEIFRNLISSLTQYIETILESAEITKEDKYQLIQRYKFIFDDERFNDTFFNIFILLFQNIKEYLQSPDNFLRIKKFINTISDINIDDRNSIIRNLYENFNPYYPFEITNTAENQCTFYKVIPEPYSKNIQNKLNNNKQKSITIINKRTSRTSRASRTKGKQTY